jgi:hypothetical protein
LPISPTCFPAEGSRRQSSSMKGVIRKAEITSITVLQFRWKTVHDCCEGKGKVELESVSGSLLVWQCHAGVFPNDWEGMSAIAMHFPAMWIGVNGHAFCIFAHRANACTRCSDTVERFDASFVTHPIVRELSLSKVSRFSSRGPQTSSMVSHKRTSPAISKSEFVMRPPRFSAIFISAATSSGHFHRKTVGTQGDSSPIIAPPVPWPEASTNPIKSGQPEMSCRQRVGSVVDYRRSVRQPSIAFGAHLFWLRYT